MYKKLTISFLGLFILLSCGREDKSPGDSGQTDERGYPPGGGVGAGQTVTTGGSSTRTLYVSNESLRPKCDRESESQLIYVRSASEFQVCVGGNWTKIDITGPRGETGAKGDKGDRGPIGPAQSPNFWYDAVSGKTWWIGDHATRTNVDASCASGRRLPSMAEALGAQNNGIGVVITQLGLYPMYGYMVTEGYSAPIPNQDFATALRIPPTQGWEKLGTGTYRVVVPVSAVNSLGQPTWWSEHVVANYFVACIVMD